MAPEQRDPDEDLPAGLRNAQLRARKVAPRGDDHHRRGHAGLALYLTIIHQVPASCSSPPRRSSSTAYYPKLTFALTGSWCSYRSWRSSLFWPSGRPGGSARNQPPAPLPELRPLAVGSCE